MKVTYLDHMGSDLTVVNAARVSFRKTSEEFEDRDHRLIKYLAEHNHWTPFGHPQISLHLKVPLFVARQIMKHQVGFVVNEVSRRYVTDDPEFYVPEVWRKAAENVKQGSSDEPSVWNHGVGTGYREEEYEYYEGTLRLYKRMLHLGVCPEQARMVLPQSMYTEFWMTGSLYGWANLYNLRSDPHTQKETQKVARQIGEIIYPLYPISWKELTCNE